MDKETIALIIAQNGLKTAATLLKGKELRLQKQLAKAKPEEQDKLNERILKAQKAALALLTADQAIVDYTAAVAAL